MPLSHCRQEGGSFLWHNFLCWLREASFIRAPINVGKSSTADTCRQGWLDWIAAKATFQTHCSLQSRGHGRGDVGVWFCGVVGILARRVSGSSTSVVRLLLCG